MENHFASFKELAINFFQSKGYPTLNVGYDSQGVRRYFLFIHGKFKVETNVAALAFVADTI